MSMQGQYIERVKKELSAMGFVVLKEKSYLAAQERQRIARVMQEEAERRVQEVEQWARGDLIPAERHMRNRLNFVYGVAVAHGATREELNGGTCECGRPGCTIGKVLPPAEPVEVGPSVAREYLRAAVIMAQRAGITREDVEAAVLPLRTADDKPTA